MRRNENPKPKSSPSSASKLTVKKPSKHKKSSVAGKLFGKENSPSKVKLGDLLANHALLKRLIEQAVPGDVAANLRLDSLLPDSEGIEGVSGFNVDEASVAEGALIAPSVLGAKLDALCQEFVDNRSSSDAATSAVGCSIFELCEEGRPVVSPELQGICAYPRGLSVSHRAIVGLGWDKLVSLNSPSSSPSKGR